MILSHCAHMHMWRLLSTFTLNYQDVYLGTAD